ncbi:MAG: hypothetical protein BroJett011_77240 [Chloroflexota bacterium]|nr:MAG: hypothetical protein BroJett011_77240 [Chloroflexota bacterium]
MMENDSPEYWHLFWQLYAESFIHPLKSNALLGKFIANPDVTGSYAEAWIRSMVRNMLPQFRISTGAVIRASDQTRNLKSIPQCDLIIWDPSELPAIFEQGDFALVPTHSVQAIIEVKRSCSNINELTKQLESRRKLLRAKCRRNLLGIVIEHPKSLFDGETRPDWLKNEKWRKGCAMVCLLSNNETPNVDDIMAFIYFLAQIAGHDEKVS